MQPVTPEYGGMLRLSAVALDYPEQDEEYLSTNSARLEYRHPFAGGGRFEVHGQLDFVAASDRSAIAATNVFAARPDRAFDLSKRPHSGDKTELQGAIDWLYYQSDWSQGQYAIGRQPVTLSLGKIWSPIDLLGPFSPLDLERLYKPGVDGLRFEYFASARWTLTSLLTLADDPISDDTHVHFWQLADWSGDDGKALVMLGHRNEQDVLALGYQANDAFASADVYGEVLFSRLGGAVRERWQEHGSVRAVIGATLRLAQNTLFTAEYFYQSLGETEPSRYAEFNRLSGSSDFPFMGIGRHNVGVTLTKQVSPLLNVESLLVINPADASSMLSALFKYSIRENVELRAAFAVPLSTGEKGAEYNQQAKVYQLGLLYYF